MKAEMKLFDEFAAGENRLNDLAKKKKWAEMQAVLEELNGLAEKIEECEDNRNTAYIACKAKMNLKEDDGFQQFLAQVPEKHREPLAKLHAGLKKRLLAIKSLSSGLICRSAAPPACEATDACLARSIAPGERETSEGCSSCSQEGLVGQHGHGFRM